MPFDFQPDRYADVKIGDILISEPFMEDRNFRRKVILLCNHGEDGSFGFVLNSFLDQALDRIVAHMPVFATRIGVGGPVKTGNLYFIHTRADLIANSHQVLDGIYMGGSFERVKELIDLGGITGEEIRFFVGYSGWGSEQLHDELKERSWFVSRTDADTIMRTDESDLWRKLLKEMGGRFASIANLPADPSLN